MHDIDLKKLHEPFPAKDVEWRIAQSGERDGKVWAKVLAYITSRAIMERLDAVCGPENWRNEFQFQPGGVMCGISIRCGGEWVTKWDGSDASDIEPFKGAISGAMKRSGVAWGVGRYLYDLEEGWANVHGQGKHWAQTKDKKNFRWDPPPLPAWALPTLHAPPPADSRAANTLSPAEQDRARQANQPPARATISRETFDRITAAGKALKFKPFKDDASEWYTIMSHYEVSRLGDLTVKQGQEVLTDLLRRRVERLMQGNGENLDDVRGRGVPMRPEADLPAELTYEECEAVIECYEEAGEGVAA